jgi:hypothetical protein
MAVGLDGFRIAAEIVVRIPDELRGVRIARVESTRVLERSYRAVPTPQAQLHHTHPGPYLGIVRRPPQPELDLVQCFAVLPPAMIEQPRSREVRLRQAGHEPERHIGLALREAQPAGGEIVAQLVHRHVDGSQRGVGQREAGVERQSPFV